MVTARRGNGDTHEEYWQSSVIVDIAVSESATPVGEEKAMHCNTYS